jgi:hypothetical protein
MIFGVKLVPGTHGQNLQIWLAQEHIRVLVYRLDMAFRQGFISFPFEV